MGAREVGRVVGLWRYPVKSMAPEALESVEVGWHGLAGDRRWAFVRPGLERSGFPWLTIRERAELLRHVPRFVRPERPDASRVVVRTPAGDEVDVVDLAESLGARVIKQNRGVFDAMPLSLLSVGAVAGVRPGLDPQRFRPNLLVDAVEPEEAWLGRVLRIGELVMRVDQRDERCAVVTVDPATLERDPSVLRTIAQEHEACLGVYGSVVSPGRVAVGDPVLV
jgi:uncharacterized protein YcbX